MGKVQTKMFMHTPGDTADSLIDMDAGGKKWGPVYWGNHSHCSVEDGGPPQRRESAHL